jgi:hypothetical protein
MIKHILSVLILMYSFHPEFIFAQINISPIRISPELGDTIDSSERNYYNLFTEINDFQYAMIYQVDSITIAKINFINDRGMIKDTIINHAKEYAGNLKAYIRQINAERLDNYNSVNKITVTKLGGNKFSGKLLAVQDSSFIICPDSISSPSTFIFLKTYSRLNTEELKSVFIESDSKPDVIWGAFIGSIIGLAVGVVVGSNETDSYYISPEFGFGIIGTFFGALAGAGVGYLISPADQTIKINSAADLELLKEYLPD